MKAIPREAGRVTYSTEIRNLKTVGFSSYEQAIILGSILGDGCLCDNWSQTNSRLSIDHSIGQREYMLWKYQALKTWILTPPRQYRNAMKMKTISHPALSELKSIFYKDKKKTIPRDIGKYLQNPLALAVWFMDDGNIRKTNSRVYGYYLNTQSFTFQENTLLAEMLKRNFNINCLVLRNHNYYRLYIGGNSKEDFVSLIRKHVIPSMKYKIG